MAKDSDQEKIPSEHLLNSIDDLLIRYRAKRMVSLISEYIRNQTTADEFYSQFLFEAESLRDWLNTSPHKNSGY